MKGIRSETFAQALRDVIEEEFDSQFQFAQAAGKSEGRVSQILRGETPVQPATLEWILATVQSTANRLRLSEAYVNDLAAVWTDVPEGTPTESVLQVIEDTGLFNAWKALKIGEEYLRRESDWRLWNVLCERMIHLHLRLSQHGQAALLLSEMEERARERGDQTQLLTSLWLRGILLRNLENVAPKLLLQNQEISWQVAGSIAPQSAPGRAALKKRKAEMARDYAVHILKLCEGRQMPPEALKGALEAAGRSMQEGENFAFQAMGLEVRARVELALGLVVKAEDTLDEVRLVMKLGGSDIHEKLTVTCAKVLLARGRTDEAIHRLLEISEYSFERQNLHHHREAEQLILKTKLSA